MKNKSPQKILIVVESIDIDDSSGSKANVALIQNLQQAGFRLLVLHYTRKDIQLPGISCISIKEKKTSTNYFLSRFQRKIQHGFGVNLAKYLEPKYGFSFTFFNDVKSIETALGEHTSFDPDLVLTLSKGASFRPHFALLNYPKYHHKWMAYIHDPYPFCYYPRPYDWNEPGFEKKIEFFERLSKKCVWAAFPSLLLKDWMQAKFPNFKGKGIIIPHQLAAVQEKDVSLPSFFNTGKFTLMHAGNLMKQRPPFYLIKAFYNFLKKTPGAEKNAELLLIGNASYHQKNLQKLQKEFPQLVVKGYLEYEKVQALQNRVSVNIILESKAEISPFLPGKFPHCIAAQKPILLLGPRKSESLRLLGQDYKYWSGTDDVEKITHLLEELYNLWIANSGTMKMERDDLKTYLSVTHMKTEIEKILN